MPINLKINSQQLVEQAQKTITRLTPQKALEEVQAGRGLLVDIRDIRELQKLGSLADAVHAPRGMLEFWVDPESPYYNSKLDQDKTLILFCALGMRSSLAAHSLQEMGVDVADIEGGFTACLEADFPIVDKGASINS